MDDQIVLALFAEFLTCAAGVCPFTQMFEYQKELEDR